MFMQRDSFPNDTLTEFSTSVESIMRCEDFKSNFARRLSNRYIARSPSIGRKRNSQLSPKLPAIIKKQESVLKIPERIEYSPQLSAKQKTEPSGIESKPPADLTINKEDDKKSFEVSILNMKVETLKWQLAQTETNRQMHLALLKRIVSFLNRVKEHMDQKKAVSPSKHLSAEVIHKATKTNLPRSRSVLHFNKNLDFNLSPGKKPNITELSKSISNVNGFKDSSYSIWNESKLSLDAETDTGQKITEEISRFITLANTVLSTKIPDLTYSCSVTNSSEKHDPIYETIKDKIEENSNTKLISHINVAGSQKDSDNAVNSAQIPSLYDTGVNHVDLELQDKTKNDPVTVKTVNDDSNFKKPITNFDSAFNRGNIFVEDESGFSSMSSFQEIGIPIINIIPPSPCKEDVFPETDNVTNETEKWLGSPLDIENNAVKVFWV